MATSPVVKLTFGARALDLNSGNYTPGVDFVPPSTRYAVQFADGTSANVFGGGVKAGQKAVNKPFQFSIRIKGDSTAEINRAANRLTSFLSLAGTDDATPLYLEYWPNSDVGFEPTWGQYGANLRYEIVHADAPQPWDVYPVADTREQVVFYNANLIMKPFALGKEQQLASATGGVLEDTIGTADGQSRGLIIPEATTNEHVNPIFGHSTYNTAWTNSANVTDTENTDPEFIVFGASSVKLVASGGSGTYTQSLTLPASTHQLSYYVKLPDGGTPSATEVEVHYNGSEQTTTFTEEGSGKWRISAEVTGTAGAADTGVTVKDGYTIYMDMAQAEQKDIVTAPCHGDLLGCVWDGTAHGGAPGTDTSTRTDGSMQVPTAGLNSTEGTILIAWKAGSDSSDITNTWGYLFKDSTSGALLAWNNSNYYRFYDGAHGINTGSDQPFNNGDIIVLHAIYSAAGKKIYVNSVEEATTATFNQIAWGSSFFLGGRTATTAQINGTFLAFQTYPRAMTAAEVAAEYANITELVNGGDGLGVRVSPIPYLWTKDGDDVVDNCDDSSRDNFGIVAGVPGDVDAVSQVFVENIDWSGFPTYWITNTPLSQFYPIDSLLNHDQDGVVDATACGGEYKQTSVNTAEVTIATGAMTVAAGLIELYGRDFTILARMQDAGSNLQLAVRVAFAGIIYISEFVTVTSSATFVLIKAPFTTVPSGNRNFFGRGVTQTGFTFDLRAKRTTAGAANVDVDYIAVVPRPLVKLTNGSAVDDAFTYLFPNATAGTTSGGDGKDIIGLGSGLNFIGGALEFSPEKINVFRLFIGDESTNPTITETSTLTMRVTPRWSLV